MFHFREAARQSLHARSAELSDNQKLGEFLRCVTGKNFGKKFPVLGETVKSKPLIAEDEWPYYSALF